MSSAAQSAPSGGCPVNHGGFPGQEAGARAEPPDTPDRPLHACQRKVAQPTVSDDPNDLVPGSAIPASGRGNSEDGKEWLNPSANQLYRSMRRKDKAIDLDDALSVAAVHEMVTDQTWKCIMEYEALHNTACPNPTLARFEGKDGIFSYKARFLNLIGVNLPFDRHDWVVDRCGTEVKYIIDYYALGEERIEYTIDARPAGVGGFVDRARLSFKKLLNGESVW